MTAKPKHAFLLEFGNRLEQIRKDKGLTYRKIADNCDLDNSYISKIAKGEANVTLETVAELVKGLNVNPKELFDFKYDIEIIC
jgi:transcriptional regulator with XRE-family HTH domain